MADRQDALQELGEGEGRMVAVLDQLHLTRLVTTIAGLSAIGAAAILAASGDPARYDIARTWAKHAGCAYATTARAGSRARPPPLASSDEGCWGKSGCRLG
jgi:transposase